MPGIFGFLKNSVHHFSIHSMKNEMKSETHFISDENFEDDYIASSRVHLGTVGEKTSPVIKKGVMIWVEGEAYNHLEISDSFGLKEKSFTNLLIEAYRNNILRDFLNRLDGYFCAVLYDHNKQHLKIFTDRYGLRMLYWYKKDGVIAWGSEVKSILALEGIDKTADETSLPCFMDNGHLLGDHTWFKHIKLVEPATIIHIDIKSKETTQEYYWTWSEIDNNESISFDDAVKKLGELFLKSVERRFSKDEDIGMGLSGGLDSRAIFAALKHIYPDYNGFVYTFGIPGCEDIKIAQQIISNTKCEYEKYYFTNKNWFKPRIDRVWKTDGMQDMKHMHGSEFSKKISNHLEIKLNGYLGDAVLGGSYLKNSEYLDQPITSDLAYHYYGHHFELGNLKSSYFDIQSIDPFLFMNRGRRFINMGLVNGLSESEYRMPFFDNQLIEFAFSLPDDYRFDNKLYGKMLMNYFPDYFRDIPWQNTGYPLGSKMPQMKKTLLYRALRKGLKLFGISIGKKSNANYTDYKNWIRSPVVSKQLSGILNSKSCFYSEYTDEDFNEKYLHPHLENKSVDYSDQILRAATFEIYLRQLNGKFNSDEFKLTNHSI